MERRGGVRERGLEKGRERRGVERNDKNNEKISIRREGIKRRKGRKGREMK